jgi:acylphosphatase
MRKRGSSSCRTTRTAQFEPPVGTPQNDSSSERKKRHASATIFRLVSETRLAKRYFVSGMVQGVGFRLFTQRAAEKLRISGFVRNLFDGRVEVLAMGTPEQHKELRSVLERGPMGSDVTEVLVEPAAVEAQYEDGFVINPSA